MDTPPRSADVLPFPRNANVPVSGVEFEARVTIGLKYPTTCARTHTVSNPIKTTGHSLASFVIPFLQRVVSIHPMPVLKGRQKFLP